MKVLVLPFKEQIFKKGENPLFFFGKLQGKGKNTPLKKKVPLKMWNNVKGCSKGKDRASVELNCYIESLTVRLYQIHKELFVSGGFGNS